MKLTLLLLFVPSLLMANNNANSFGQGFADAVNVRLGGRPYQPPTQTVENVYVEPVTVTYHYDAINDVGTRGNYYFFNAGECSRFVGRNPGAYNECIKIPD